MSLTPLAKCTADRAAAGDRHGLADLGERGVDVVHRGAGAALEHHLRRVDADDPGRRTHRPTPPRPRSPSASRPLDADRVDRADGGGELVERVVHRDPCAVGDGVHVAAGGGIRQHLVRIRDQLRIERHPQRLLRGQVDLGEHQRHQVTLLEADAVLAGQHPADRHRERDDLPPRLVHLVDHPRLPRVVHEQRVEVAVAGVEHVDHVDAVPLR